MGSVIPSFPHHLPQLPLLPPSCHTSRYANWGHGGEIGLGWGWVAVSFCSTQVLSGAALPHVLHRGLWGSCLGSLSYINERGPWPTPLVCLCSGSPFAGQAFAACSCKWGHLFGVAEVHQRAWSMANALGAPLPWHPFAGQASAACSCKWAHVSGGRPGVQVYSFGPGTL